MVQCTKQGMGVARFPQPNTSLNRPGSVPHPLYLDKTNEPISLSHHQLCDFKARHLQRGGLLLKSDQNVGNGEHLIPKARTAHHAQLGGCLS